MLPAGIEYSNVPYGGKLPFKPSHTPPSPVLSLPDETLGLGGVLQKHRPEEAGEMTASLESVCNSSVAVMICSHNFFHGLFSIYLFILIFAFNHLGLTGKHLVVFNPFYCFVGSLDTISFLKLTYSRYYNTHP